MRNIVVRLIFMDCFIAIFLRASALAADIGHEAIESLFSLADEIVDRLKFRLFDIFQYTRINQTGKRFVKFAACNGIEP